MMDERSLINQARTLVGLGQADEALAITQAATREGASHGLIAVHVEALKALGRQKEALVLNLRATRSWPTSGVAWHNLAATLGDLGQAEEALGALDRAFGLGLDAAATWLVKARALRQARRMEQAETAYRECLRRAPDMTDAACELVQLIWVNSGDLGRADEVLTVAMGSGGDRRRLIYARSQLLEVAGRPADGRALLIDQARRHPNDVGLTLLGVPAAVTEGAVDEALTFARRAQAGDPGDVQVNIHLAMALLAAGQADEALKAARRATVAAPQAQDAWGWVATTARAAGDPQYEALYDYDAFVRPYDIEPPAPWTDLATYLDDLAAALDALHDDVGAPYDQSVRHGTQTFGELQLQQHPAIQGFYRAMDAPIRRYMADIGQGDDPLRSRNTGQYRLTGSWSVRLRDQGRHTDHFHPEGWLSSAFYVRLPERAMATGQAGCIRFGQSPFPSQPMMPAAHYVRPKAGRLVLFPSYMWHGTEPFEGEETRLTIAFDVAPA